jgi:hypothetical protein
MMLPPKVSRSTIAAQRRHTRNVGEGFRGLPLPTYVLARQGRIRDPLASSWLWLRMTYAAHRPPTYPPYSEVSVSDHVPESSSTQSILPLSTVTSAADFSRAATVVRADWFTLPRDCGGEAREALEVIPPVALREYPFRTIWAQPRHNPPRRESLSVMHPNLLTPIRLLDEVDDGLADRASRARRHRSRPRLCVSYAGDSPYVLRSTRRSP